MYEARDRGRWGPRSRARRRASADLRGDHGDQQSDPGQGGARDAGHHRRPPAAADGARQPARSGPRSGPRWSGTASWSPAARPSGRLAAAAAGAGRGHRRVTAPLRVLPLGGLGRDRQEHDRRRARRADRRGRHRADVPDHRDAGNRPGAARLLLPSRSRRRHRGDRPHPRARGPRRGAALRPARDRDAAGDLRRRADDRPGALEARGAPAARRARSRCWSAGERVRLGPVRARAGPHGALDPRLPRGRPAHRARRRC